MFFRRVTLNDVHEHSYIIVQRDRLLPGIVRRDRLLPGRFGIFERRLPRQYNFRPGTMGCMH